MRDSLFRLFVSLLISGGLSQVDAQERSLIIHADDAGMSHSVNLATIEALESGLVTSASIMVPCPWFTEFAEYARTHPQYDYGIHLTLNCEWKLYKWGPVASAKDVPSLLDESGFLWGSVPEVAANVRAEEVERELRAQIDRAVAAGVPLSHLDTHMGALVSRPDLIEVYVRLGIDYDLPVLFLRTLDEQTAKAYPAIKESAGTLLPVLDEHRLPVLDRLVQFYGGDTHEQRREAYFDAIRNLEPGVSQLIIHCGILNEELKAITNSAERRDGDRRIFTAGETRELLQQENITLLTWKQFRSRVAAELSQ
ncbi:MAG: polysaccharide deacetylase family protein [Planctomycetaceae bacterium]|nr:polysaccharide deacetylase family protein [Planctomycetaceae bacterium]